VGGNHAGLLRGRQSGGRQAIGALLHSAHGCVCVVSPHRLKLRKDCLFLAVQEGDRTREGGKGEETPT
jgi:hypothetical protein